MQIDASYHGLAHWLTLPDGRIGLEFTEEGWALAEGCAMFGEFDSPKGLVVFMMGQIINQMVDHPIPSKPLPLYWQPPQAPETALVAFDTDVLNEVAGSCDVPLPQFQATVQCCMEFGLLQMYQQRPDNRRLH